jgi:iron complex transport system substrate-binding protein
MVLALPAILLAAACGGTSSADKTATAGAKPAATTAATAPAGTATSAAPAATTYPLTITDMLGKSVTIAAEPQSVAAISPTTVEFVYAVGGTSKTRPSSVTLAAAASAKDIGSSYQPNLELIAAEKPDLIVADAVLQPQLAQSLAGLNVPVLYVGASNFADVLTGFDIIGKVLNKPAEAAKLAGDLQTKLADLQKKEGATKPKVLILNGAPQDFYAAKPESYAGDLVKQLGGDNVAAGQPDVGQFPGYTKLSLESIIAAAPDVILAITAGPPGGKTITETLSADPAWADIPAVKNKRVSEISADLFLMAPGPQVGAALDELAKLLYPSGTSP